MTQKKPKKSAASKKKANTTSRTKQSAKTQKPVQKRKGLLRLAYWGSVFAVWVFIAGGLALAWLAHDLPDLDNPPLPGATDKAVVIKAANGATIARRGPIYGAWVGYDQIPDAMIRAILAVEDRRFFSHSGIDIKGLFRAVVTNVRHGRVRAGGSTLTQQLAKNLFLGSERSFTRKARELLLAFWLEQKFTKEQIITLYLNRVYFGGGTYGIDAASQSFFGHSAQNLSIPEAALLAGLVKAPSRLAPHINPDGAWQRGQVVLDTMTTTGSLTIEAAAKLKTQRPPITRHGFGAGSDYFVDWVMAQANRLIPNDSARSLILYTTLDPAIQRAGDDALNRALKREGKAKAASQGAVVAVDLNGAVRAMVGGRHYGQSQYNRTTQAVRQPGSAFKLFSYIAAIEQGLKATDTYVDEKITVDGWSPKNYSGKYSGVMTAREAFARSVNTIAVKISEDAGRDKVAATAKRLGITTSVSPIASLPLGSEEVRLLDLTSAYAAVANGGFRVEPFGIVEITGLEGDLLYSRRPRAQSRVLNPATVNEITPFLQSVITWGSGRQAQIDREAAGKSGTSQDSRDAVFAGFTSDLAATVWVGNDDGSPMKNVTGGTIPAQIWADFMLDAHAGAPVRPLLVDRILYEESAAEAQSFAPKTEKKKKKRGLLSRLFGKKD